MESKLEAAVGMSRKWDAREAGREVAETAIRQLHEPPSFFLLFSTIHYEKNGGFQQFLNGVWDVLPKRTPLIGGTVAGFMNPQGCYTRGASALAVSYSNMDVAVGIGRNTKRNPRNAARTCADNIRKTLDNSGYPYKFIYELISGSSVPNIPFIGRRRVLTGKTWSILAHPFSSGILGQFQMGPGREEEVISALVGHLPDYHLIGGSTMDDNSMLTNYQFYGNNVHTNSIVALGIRTDQCVNVNTTYGLNDSKISLKVTKLGRDKRTIMKINNKSALDEYLKAIGMDIEFIDERLHRRTMFTPLGYWQNNILFPNVIGLCLGKNIVVGFQVQNKDLHLLLASGKSLNNAVDENLEKFRGKNNSLGLIVSCAARLETLGKDIYVTREKLLNFFNKTPFLLIYAGGEDTYIPDIGQRHINESFNVATFSMNY